MVGYFTGSIIMFWCLGEVWRVGGGVAGGVARGIAGGVARGVARGVGRDVAGGQSGRFHPRTYWSLTNKVCT